MGTIQFMSTSVIIQDAPEAAALDQTGRPIPDGDEDHLPPADLQHLATLQPTRDQCATRRHKRLHARVLRQVADRPGYQPTEEELVEAEEAAGNRVDLRNALYRQQAEAEYAFLILHMLTCVIPLTLITEYGRRMAKPRCTTR